MSAGASSAGAKTHERLKKGLDNDDMRRKREATTVQIRKDKKDESIQKRRRDVGGSTSVPTCSLTFRSVG